MTHDSIAAVLQALAAGQIDAETARIALDRLSRPSSEADPIDLYDTPPARAMTDEFGPDASAGTQAPSRHDEEVVETEPVVADPQDEPRVEPVEFDEPDPSAEEINPEPSPSTPDPSATPDQATLADVAATAGAVLREAGGLAAHTLGRLGRLAGGMLGESRPGATNSRVVVPPARLAGETRKVVVRSVGRRVRIVADSSVPTIKVSGPHTLRRSQTTLEVLTEGEIGFNLDVIGLVNPLRSVEDLRTASFGPELEVRVNPLLVVDAEVVGSRLIVQDVPMIGRVRVTVGGASLLGVREVGDALVQACNATVAGRWTSGRSRVKVESGNLTLRITPDSNVTARARTQLGRVAWPGDVQGTLDEFAVGDGTANLQLDVVLGRAQVRVEN